MNNAQFVGLSCRAVTLTGEERAVPYKLTAAGEARVRLELAMIDCSDIAYIDVGCDLVTARSGDDGYLVVPQGFHKSDSFSVFFTERDDIEYEAESNCLSVFGVCRGEDSFAAICDGMNAESRVVAGVKNGQYYLYVRYRLDGMQLYEPIAVVYQALSADADYAAVARAYRTYLLETGICTPLSARHSDALDYAKGSLYIRVRQAWKPVPSPIPEQTDENEPEVQVACDFDDVIALMEDCHAAGIEKAEFCLVGWNKSGHDGRWPQIFPVEPKLGGEEGLRRLIARAKELGYTVGCHTNSTEQYSVATLYDEDSSLHDKEGIVYDRHMWGGGLARKLCPQKAYELALEELPKVKALGFNAIHYVDVLSVERIPPCHNPLHPLTTGESLAYTKKIGMLCRELFGGYSSEGARDHSRSELDFGLYVSMADHKGRLHALADCRIPLWQLVFHGIILANPYASTVNPAIKGRETELVMYEYGARPSFYFYSKFMTDPTKDWMGCVDMRCHTAEERQEAVSHLKRIWEEYKQYAYLQELFMEQHEVLSDGKVRVTYSDGSKLCIDRQQGTVELKK